MRPCPIPGCRRGVASVWVLMCRTCWDRVPKDVQARLYSAWRALRAETRAETVKEYKTARDAAIAAALVESTEEARP